MSIYCITYKLFEFDDNFFPIAVEDGEGEVEASSEQEAIAEAQQTIGLYVMECVKK